MSDTGRKDFTTKAEEKLTPDSSKSGVDKLKESVTGSYDNVAKEGTSDDSKGAFQGLADKASRVKDDIVGGNK